MQEFKYLESFKYPTYLVLNLTDNCNLACRYCFVQQKPHYMTLDTAKEAVNFLEHNFQIKKEKSLFTSKDNRKTIIFFGGEPTILFDEIIVPLIHYIEDTYTLVDYVFHITTNCTLLNKERIEFLKKYNILPLLSIDGDKTTQDYNRPSKNSKESSFDMVYKNIPLILDKFPTAIFRSTVYKDTIKYLYENYLFAEKMNFKFYICCPDYRSMNWDQTDLEEYEKQLTKIAVHIIQQYQDNKEPKTQCLNFLNGINDILNYDCDIILNKNRKWQDSFNQFRCGLGTSSCSINYAGDIFSCQEQDSREHGDYFYIGDIYNGINEKLHSKIIKDYLFNHEEKPSKCKSCFLEHICEHGCPSVSKDVFNKTGTMSDIHCQCLQMQINIARIIILVLTEQNNPIFTKTILKKMNEIYLWRR